MGACAYFMPSTEHKLKVPKLQDAVGHTVETDRWLPSISRVYFPSKGRSLPRLCKSCANFCVCYRQLVVSRETGCAVKRRWSTAGVNPPGNWFAPPGSNQSSRGGNETAEASGAESR